MANSNILSPSWQEEHTIIVQINQIEGRYRKGFQRRGSDRWGLQSKDQRCATS